MKQPWYTIGCCLVVIWLSCCCCSTTTHSFVIATPKTRVCVGVVALADAPRPPLNDDKDVVVRSQTLPSDPENKETKSQQQLLATPLELRERLPSPLVLFGGWAIFVGFWIVLALGRIYWTEHDFEIDVNQYMILKDVLQLPPSEDESMSTILELPGLSPAEKLVDTLFGPNHVDRRGF